jgi:hypothetical protein
MVVCSVLQAGPTAVHLQFPTSDLAQQWTSQPALLSMQALSKAYHNPAAVLYEALKLMRRTC